jgi:hypothetical protein
MPLHSDEVESFFAECPQVPALPHFEAQARHVWCSAMLAQ